MVRQVKFTVIGLLSAGMVFDSAWADPTTGVDANGVYYVNIPKGETNEMDSAWVTAAIQNGGAAGKGKVVVSSDILLFQPTRIEHADNAKLLENVLDYLK